MRDAIITGSHPGYPRSLEEMMRQRECLMRAPSSADIPLSSAPFVAWSPAAVAEVAEHMARSIKPESNGAAGFAVVTGVPIDAASESPTLELQQSFTLRVWRSITATGTVPEVVCGTGAMSDGVEQGTQFARQWTYKSLHMDRKSMLFSHCYGPMRGYAGGHILIADALGYMRSKALTFEELFEWDAGESRSGRLVVQRTHQEAMLASHGFDLGQGCNDWLLLVNNAPGAGIVHGATTVFPSSDSYVRRIQRCSIKPFAR